MAAEKVDDFTKSVVENRKSPAVKKNMNFPFFGGNKGENNKKLNKC